KPRPTPRPRPRQSPGAPRPGASRPPRPPPGPRPRPRPPPRPGPSMPPRPRADAPGRRRPATAPMRRPETRSPRAGRLSRLASWSDPALLGLGARIATGLAPLGWWFAPLPALALALHRIAGAARPGRAAFAAGFGYFAFGL